MAREPQRITQSQEPVAISADHVHQWLALPDVAMEPESTVHGVDHPVSAPEKLATAMGHDHIADRGDYSQVIVPSRSAGATGAALAKYTAQMGF